MSAGNPTDPILAWRFVQKLLDEEELERLDAMTNEELERELEAAGVRVPSTHELMERAKARSVPASAMAETRILPLSRSRRWLLFAAVLGTLALFVVVAGKRKAIVAWLCPVDIVADDRGASLATATMMAESLRTEGFSACSDAKWDLCAEKLDAAARLDPAGEGQDSVKAARQTLRSARSVTHSVSGSSDMPRSKP